MKPYMMLASSATSDPLLISDGSIYDYGMYASWTDYATVSPATHSGATDPIYSNLTERLDMGSYGNGANRAGARNNNMLPGEHTRITYTVKLRLDQIQTVSGASLHYLAIGFNWKDTYMIEVRLQPGVIRCVGTSGDNYYYTDIKLNYFYITVDINTSTELVDVYYNNIKICDQVGALWYAGTTKGTFVILQHEYNEDPDYVRRIAYLDHCWIGRDLQEI